MSRLVLDCGALIGLEKNDLSMWAAVRLAASREDPVIIPTTALAQVWRGSPAQARLAAVVQASWQAPFDRVWREVGILCGRTGTRDVCDGHVAHVAATQGDVLYTSDPDDMRRLLAELKAHRVRIVRC